MDFDPLSFFSAESKSILNERLLVDHAKVFFGDNIESYKSTAYDEFNDDHLQPIHIFDLPMLQLKPPAEVMMVILRLLSPNKVYNFQKIDSGCDSDDKTEIFEEKNVDEKLLQTSLEWLSHYCPRFDTKLKLRYIPKLSSSLKKNFELEYNAYFTNIISSELAWIDEPYRSAISKEATLRLSENCGRTAQPEIIRNISLHNLSKYLRFGLYIRLKEPSLTGDNLGLKTWGSSLILADRLINRKRDYLVEPILELGSGTGLVGIVSCLLGHQTTLTDLPEILPNLKENVLLNNVDAEVFELDWAQPQQFTGRYGEAKFKTILISDPIYSSEHPDLVFNMIQKFLQGSEDSRVLIQIPLRPTFEAEREKLWKLLDESLKEIESEVEDGRDDFGETKYLFKRYAQKLAK
ncbi:uncharacterized protein PRCAT00003449001 [Priceomyces carsonii]|uniref:uncharacterized protein n=1 Tax=Priceomyces carsonii TaxID=28549 RepID=UPI002ED9527F|nr:unnamed protein product [Priceomyces carsonii]